ncbi:MAG: ADP-forming succinate--CoA ligase subunit beta [Candidatus Bathyarchaeota archaeon]|nr:ADP-forming succinate--CoA ligase subunit beta [Candidatus Bathyarchaeota archaeon]
MKLFEYEAKKILAEHGIPTPKGELASSPAEAREKASHLKAPYVIKAQVLVAGRGKAGGILFADTPEDVETAAGSILGLKIKGLKVDSVWIEERIEIKKELYFGITIDRSRRCHVVIASTAGGIDIEEVAANRPQEIIKLFVDPLLGFRGFHAMNLASGIGYSGRTMLKLAGIFKKLYRVAMDYDAELIEMNPLVEAVDGGFIAADARLLIDDNALFRHPLYKNRLLSEDKTELNPEEIRARKAGLAYVKLDGNIGIMGNGAGLVMATLDAVQGYGGKPSNFLDVGGGASEEQIVEALNILLTDTQASVIFINILGGITRCDNVARGILEAKKRAGLGKPVVIRLVGTNEEEGRHILTEAGIQVLDSMEKAAKLAVEMVSGEK